MKHLEKLNGEDRVVREFRNDEVFTPEWSVSVRYVGRSVRFDEKVSARPYHL